MSLNFTPYCLFPIFTLIRDPGENIYMMMFTTKQNYLLRIFGIEDTKKLDGKLKK